MGFALREGITCCRIGERYVFLDTVSDRYFCLTRDADAAFHALVEGGVPAVGRLAVLEARGVLLRDGGDGRPSAIERGPPPQRSLLDLAQSRSHPAAVVGALWRIARARAGVRRHGLDKVLTRLAAQKARVVLSGKPPGGDLAELAAAFEKTARIVRSHDQCLTRSIALAHLCLARGLLADLVIGVCLRPFGAHAWVEAPGLLVNDRFDTVRLYKPILAI